MPWYHVQIVENAMRHRPIPTGTNPIAAYYSKPLPWVKVQPFHVNMTIGKGIRARSRRRANIGLMEHAKAKAAFEGVLENAARFGQKFQRVFDRMGWPDNLPYPLPHARISVPSFKAFRNVSTATRLFPVLRTPTSRSKSFKPHFTGTTVASPTRKSENVEAK